MSLLPRIKLLCFLLVLFALQLTAAPPAAAQEVGSERVQVFQDDLVLYEPGNMPVILLAPHDGVVKPDGVPLRKNGIRDVNSSKLARQILAELSYVDADGVERKPYLVMSLANRAVVDPNRSWKQNVDAGWFHPNGEKAKPPSRAKRIHRAFHSSAKHAVSSVQGEFGTGLLLDIHGLSARRKLDMYGYLIRASDLRMKSESGEPLAVDALADAVRTRSSIRHAASRKQSDEQIVNLIRGPHSLASMVNQEYVSLAQGDKGGRKPTLMRRATPSEHFPDPKAVDTPDKDWVYFNGAYDIQAHSSFQNGITVDAIQIETLPSARNTREQRQRFAQSMANATRRFMELHYGLVIDNKPTEATTASWNPSERKISFNRDVRPILSDNCFHCHGPDIGTREAGLRLDTAEGLAADLDGLPLIAPGDPDDSELYLRLKAFDPRDRMPHPDSGKTLTAAQIKTIRLWIEQGAGWEGHWAYQAPQPNKPPEPTNENWPRSPVDHFVLQRLDQLDWQPALDADARTLVRRLYQDLTGLPPTDREVRHFVRQVDIDGRLEPAIHRVVEQLMQSPHFAERMAVHWLDLVRYADTVGYHGDQDRSMSPYRDYVLQAFQSNMPMDQFFIEQLAGDLLPDATLQQKIASGYNRLNQITAEGGAQEKEYRAIYAADRVRTTGTVFLGSTMGCAQCHDHKFDPITAKDFYSMAAFFSDLEERGVFLNANRDGNWGPKVAVPTAEQSQAIAEAEATIQQLEVELATTIPEIAAQQKEWQQSLKAKLPIQAEDFDWIDDAQNNGGSTEGGWEFVGAEVIAPLGGDKVRRQQGSGIVQHFFRDATRTVRIGPGDKFYAHVWIDPDNPPQTLMLQFYENGSWNHRAFWGADKINFGGIGAKNGGHWPMGELPSPGKWVRLEVDPATVGLKEGTVVRGLAFTQFDGLAYWDRAGLHAKNPLHSLHGIDLAIQYLVSKPDEQRSAEERQTLAAHYRGNSPLLSSTRAELDQTQAQLSAARASVATTLISKSTQPREMRIKPRGNWMDDSGEIVQPAVPAFLPQPDNADGRRLTRLDLAHWIVDSRNPLTARVFVNRIWAIFYGRGLVKTLGDFGSQGEWPEHVELLDWLAMDFIEHDWDLRHLIRQIVTSRSYRQSSTADAALRLRDPENVYIGRQASFRLDAEFVRDHALAASGLLNTTVGGKSVKPYQPAGFWRELNFPVRKWEHDPSANGLRRGLYTYWCRTYLHPSLAAFDAVTREECSTERTRSNTPQQALTLLNDPTYTEAARGLALRILREAPNDDSARIRFAFQTTLQREPRSDELDVMRKYLLQFQVPTDANEVNAFLGVGDHAAIGDADPNEVMRWTAVARVLLNLHEFITRY